MHKINRDGILLSICLIAVIWAPLKLLPLFDALESQFKIIIYLIIFIGCFWLGYRFAKKYGQKKLNKLFLQPYIRIPLILIIPISLSFGIIIRMPDEVADKDVDDGKTPTTKNCKEFTRSIDNILTGKSQIPVSPVKKLEILEQTFPDCKVTESIRDDIKIAEKKWEEPKNAVNYNQLIASEDNNDGSDQLGQPNQDAKEKSSILPPSSDEVLSDEKINAQNKNHSISTEEIATILSAGEGESSTTTHETYRKAYRAGSSFIEDMFKLLGGGIGGAFGSKTTTVHKIVKSTSTTSYDKAGVIQQLKEQFTNLDKNQAYELRKAMIAALMNQIQDGGLSEKDANDILNSIDNFLDKNNPPTKDANSKLNAWINDTCKKLIEGETFREGMTLPVSTSEAIIKCLKERVDDAPTREKYVELVIGVTDR